MDKTTMYKIGTFIIGLFGGGKVIIWGRRKMSAEAARAEAEARDINAKTQAEVRAIEAKVELTEAEQIQKNIVNLQGVVEFYKKAWDDLKDTLTNVMVELKEVKKECTDLRVKMAHITIDLEAMTNENKQLKDQILELQKLLITNNGLQTGI